MIKRKGDDSPMVSTNETFSEQIGCRLYCIRNDKGEFWSNDWGWLVVQDDDDNSQFTIFTEDERDKFSLPIEGKWEVI